MKNKLWVVPIEPIENRYSGHWHYFLPRQLTEALGDKFDIFQVEADYEPTPPKAGEFLNFSDTIRFKNSQMNDISRYFEEGAVTKGDVFLFTDAWNPSILYLRYLSVTHQIPIAIYGIWHAGAYDKNDILGQRSKKMHSSSGMAAIEQALAANINYNIFATNYHLELFRQTYPDTKNCYATGFPMSYYKKLDIPNCENREKIIVFPHRKSKEKHPELFYGLQDFFPDYKLIFTQDVCRNKDEYHELLSKAEYCFSASDQETLGISVYEAGLAGCKPILPNRLSYKELWYDNFRYNDYYDIPEKVKTMSKELLADNVRQLSDTYFLGQNFYELLRDPGNVKQVMMNSVRPYSYPYELKSWLTASQLGPTTPYSYDV